MLLVSVGAFLFAPRFAVHPHIDMGGYKGKVKKISGKVHIFLTYPLKCYLKIAESVILYV